MCTLSGVRGIIVYASDGLDDNFKFSAVHLNPRMCLQKFCVCSKDVTVHGALL